MADTQAGRVSTISDLIRCGACTNVFEPNHHARKYCSKTCSRRMNKFASVCNSRLRSVADSFDRWCEYCGQRLPPLAVGKNGLTGGQKKYHAKCLAAYKNETVGQCKCGNDLRRRDGPKCVTCYRRSQRKRIVSAGELEPCSAAWREGDALVKCHKDVYPLMDMCSKHLHDIRRFGEPKPFNWDHDEIDSLVIPQKQIVEWREKLLLEQGGQCAMTHCLATVENNDAWDLDHDHDCGFHIPKRMCERCVRGVLCGSCNRMLLGQIEKVGDPVAVVKSVLSYLEDNQTQLSLAL